MTASVEAQAEAAEDEGVVFGRLNQAGIEKFREKIGLDWPYNRWTTWNEEATRDGIRHYANGFGDDNALALHLLEHGVAVVAASAFGGRDGFRISFAADEAVLEEAMRRIAAALV